MMGGCRSKGRGPARLRLPEGQKKTFCGVGRLKQSHSPARAPTLRGTTPPRVCTCLTNTHFCWFSNNGAGLLWAWGRAQSLLPFWVAFTSPFSSLPPSPKIVRPFADQEKSLDFLCRLPLTQSGTLSPKPLDTSLFSCLALPRESEGLVSFQEEQSQVGDLSYFPEGDTDA